MGDDLQIINPGSSTGEPSELIYKRAKQRNSDRSRVVRVAHEADASDARDQLHQERHSLGTDIASEIADAGHVAARLRQACYQTSSDRIGNSDHDSAHGLSRRLWS